MFADSSPRCLKLVFQLLASVLLFRFSCEASSVVTACVWDYSSRRLSLNLALFINHVTRKLSLAIFQDWRCVKYVKSISWQSLLIDSAASPSWSRMDGMSVCARGVRGLDFVFFGSGLLLPPRGSGVRFSLLQPDPDWIWILCSLKKYYWLFAWLTFIRNYTGFGLLVSSWYWIRSAFGFKFWKTGLDPDSKTSESAHLWYVHVRIIAKLWKHSVAGRFFAVCYEVRGARHHSRCNAFTRSADSSQTCVFVCAVHLRERMITSKKFRNEPGKGLSSLSFPVINRIHFASLRENQRKVMANTVGSHSTAGNARVNRYSSPAYRFPHLDGLACMAEELSLHFQRAYFSRSWSLSGVTTQQSTWE